MKSISLPSCLAGLSVPIVEVTTKLSWVMRCAQSPCSITCILSSVASLMTGQWKGLEFLPKALTWKRTSFRDMLPKSQFQEFVAFLKGCIFFCPLLRIYGSTLAKRVGISQTIPLFCILLCQSISTFFISLFLIIWLIVLLSVYLLYKCFMNHIGTFSHFLSISDLNVLNDFIVSINSELLLVKIVKIAKIIEQYPIYILFIILFLYFYQRLSSNCR